MESYFFEGCCKGHRAADFTGINSLKLKKSQKLVDKICRVDVLMIKLMQLALPNQIVVVDCFRQFLIQIDHYF